MYSITRKTFMYFVIIGIFVRVFLILSDTTNANSRKKYKVKHSNRTNGNAAIYSGGMMNCKNGSLKQMTLREIKDPNRLQDLKNKCNSNNKFTNISGRKPIFFYAESPGLAVCKAPKTGSTFIAAFIMALKSSEAPHKVFRINREYIHGNNEVAYKDLSSLKGIKVIVSRDPYMRLYSVYMDKIFLMCPSIAKEMVRGFRYKSYTKTRDFCDYNVTFQQFLDFTINQASSGNFLDEHMLPISDLCYPCHVQYDIEIRQETLSVDTEGVLNILKVPEARKTAIISTVKYNRTTNAILSLIASYLTYYECWSIDCRNRTHYMEKVWKIFQAQGYINQYTAFPKWYFEKIPYLNTEKIASFILNMREKHLQTNEDIKQQRLSYVLAAYRNVKSDTIDKIKEVYKKDFLLFGYDTTPPHKRK